MKRYSLGYLSLNINLKINIGKILYFSQGTNKKFNQNSFVNTIIIQNDYMILTFES